MAQKANDAHRAVAPGPFRADQIREGDSYELSNGHPIFCAPTGGQGASTNATGALALLTDPEASSGGIDVGFSPEDTMLRAPDIAVGNVPEAPGWVRGVPSLAVEYADSGQDEKGLQAKIHDLLQRGTRYLWVVRLVGPRRVEVYEPEKPMTKAVAGQLLHAPGVLRNPVPVEALYDRTAAIDVALQNILQRKGYADLNAIRVEAREEGREEAQKEALRLVLKKRGFAVSPKEEAHIQACHDQAVLERWLEQALTATSVQEVLESFPLTPLAPSPSPKGRGARGGKVRYRSPSMKDGSDQRERHAADGSQRPPQVRPEGAPFGRW